MAEIKELLKRKGVVLKRLGEVPKNTPKHEKLARELILIKVQLGEMQFKSSPSGNFKGKVQ